ncbi:MAG: ComEC/Rec2 family competence protein [Roseibium sp.]
MTERQDPDPEKDSRLTSAPMSDAPFEIVSSNKLDPLLSFLQERARARNKPFVSRQKDAGTQVFERFWDKQGLLWTGFAFVIGIYIYRVLPEESHWAVLSFISLFSGLVGLSLWREKGLSPSVILILATVAGLTVATVRTAIVQAPRLGEPMSVTLTARVLDIDRKGSGTRVLLQTLSVNNRQITNIEFPERVRLRVSPKSELRVGDGVETQARLFPPAGPVTPGGYDFSFRAYYSRLGATGFSYGEPKRIDLDSETVATQTTRLLAGFRHALAERIKGILPGGPEQALAVALLVGERSGIAHEVEENLRKAGLAHILAISGLHMALFAGGAFATCLGVLALFPAAVLRMPIQKIAAGLALAAAVFYLLLSGASVATQRSFLMISLVFLGIMIGRRGLTLRSVALAGLVLLILAPERLFFPGFQMSFAAVISLVAVYDIWRQRQIDRPRLAPDRPFWANAVRKAGHYAAALFVTALVAGLATGIVGAHHFARIAPYGLIGNMLGMPVFSVIVMPMGVLALALMPFGLAAIPLSVMATGLSLLLAISEFTSELTADSGLTGNLSAAAAVCLVSGLFVLLLLPGRLRFFSSLPIAAGVSLAVLDRPPDIQIASAGTRIAARDETGQLRLSSGATTFQNAIWMQVEGLPESAIKSRKMKSHQRYCESHGCVIHAYTKKPGAIETVQPIRIAYPKTAEALELDCKNADIIVSDIIAKRPCSATVVFDKTFRQARGAISIWLSDPKQSEPRQYDHRYGATPQSRYPEKPDSAKPVISRISYAVPKIVRPWHKLGSVMRRSLNN